MGAVAVAVGTNAGQGVECSGDEAEQQIGVAVDELGRGVDGDVDPEGVRVEGVPPEYGRNGPRGGTVAGQRYESAA
ncbi:hypothetical protein GCM10010140_77190 [Streptosporangium pseudovulgare]|uniref:Uncharacterized protein n=1 Tax=Streptosporangium pseudovulgare TaxID=35765 RepID=A0ABQ2RP06_9ACTN|nr:hypothetical protein GCM10010140_77190 [Streptosporangium pseudovulgare]